ncbi:C-type lectin 37Db-like [Neocloeon triangulifer]|uniref:C-type lectin 37Db-like n=1 Tax=Neocloeon triangulifer TaxID=2078957 RepID=UPI00286F8759|nr:C-type lectin 37Db-like [Neocloeon triangulifer]
MHMRVLIGTRMEKMAQAQILFLAAISCALIPGQSSLIETRGLTKGAANRVFTFGNGTYEISTSMAGWVQAKNDCRSKGMKLLSIESAEENNAMLEQIVLRPGDSFWTSGSDLGHEGNFYWEATGLAVSGFKYWAPGQPDNAQSGSEHCLEISAADNHLWNDNKCDVQHFYICESHPCEEK